jgi:hypothetical protein
MRPTAPTTPIAGSARKININSYPGAVHTRTDRPVRAYRYLTGASTWPGHYSFGQIRERSARPSASQKGIRKTSDVTSLPNPAMYENQAAPLRGAAARRRVRRSPRRALRFGAPARRTRAVPSALGRRLRRPSGTGWPGECGRFWRHAQDERWLIGLDIASLSDIERIAILVHLAGNADPMIASAVVDATGWSCCELVEVGE